MILWTNNPLDIWSLNNVFVDKVIMKVRSRGLNRSQPLTILCIYRGKLDVFPCSSKEAKLSDLFGFLSFRLGCQSRDFVLTEMLFNKEMKSHFSFLVRLLPPLQTGNTRLRPCSDHQYPCVNKCSPLIHLSGASLVEQWRCQSRGPRQKSWTKLNFYHNATSFKEALCWQIKYMQVHFPGRLHCNMNTVF